MQTSAQSLVRRTGCSCPHTQQGGALRTLRRVDTGASVSKVKPFPASSGCRNRSVAVYTHSDFHGIWVSVILHRTRGSQLARRASSTEQEGEVKQKSEEDRGDAIELDPESDQAKKKAEADRLRAAEKFMTVGTGKALCVSCGYEYEEKRGDPEYPVGPGTKYQELPRDWQCPVCGAPKNTFQNKAIKLAGFAENQQYGFGGNSLTSGQKSLLIYGSLLFFFGLFIAGYTLQ